MSLIEETMDVLHILELHGDRGHTRGGCCPVTVTVITVQHLPSLIWVLWWTGLGLLS